MLSGPVLARAGLISYSLYLWHEPVLLWLDQHVGLEHAPGWFPVTAVVLLAASVPVAFASHALIERPFGRLRHLLRADGSRRDRYAQV